MDLAKEVAAKILKDCDEDKERAEVLLRDTMVCAPVQFARFMSGDKVPPAPVIARMRKYIGEDSAAAPKPKAKANAKAKIKAPAGKAPAKKEPRSKAPTDPEKADPRRFKHLNDIAAMTQNPAWKWAMDLLSKEIDALSEECLDYKTKDIKWKQGKIAGLKALFAQLLSEFEDYADLPLFDLLDVKINKRDLVVHVSRKKGK